MTNDGYVAMQVIQAVNGWLFGGPVLILLFGIHVYFTIYTGVVQRKLGTGIRLSLRGTGTEKKGMSSFGTLTTTLAATLGTSSYVKTRSICNPRLVLPAVFYIRIFSHK